MHACPAVARDDIARSSIGSANGNQRDGTEEHAVVRVWDGSGAGGIGADVVAFDEMVLIAVACAAAAKGDLDPVVPVAGDDVAMSGVGAAQCWSAPVLCNPGRRLDESQGAIAPSNQCIGRVHFSMEDQHAGVARNAGLPEVVERPGRDAVVLVALAP